MCSPGAWKRHGSTEQQVQLLFGIVSSTFEPSKKRHLQKSVCIVRKTSLRCYVSLLHPIEHQAIDCGKYEHLEGSSPLWMMMAICLWGEMKERANRRLILGFERYPTILQHVLGVSIWFYWYRKLAFVRLLTMIPTRARLQIICYSSDGYQSARSII